MKSQHEIGLKFIRYSSKRKDIETVVDILTTTNSKGDVIKIEYVTEHDFSGQTITDIIPCATISRSEKV